MSVATEPAFRSRQVQLPVVMVSAGHAATHWIAATFYLLLPFIARELGLSYAQTGVIVTCFHLGSTLANLPSGSLVDLTGRRVLIQAVAVIVGSMALFVLGMVDSYGAICALVVLIGVTNMLWHPAAISFLSRLLPNNRGYALSIHALGANLGDAIAPMVAGWLLLTLSWGDTARVNALLGVACGVALLLVLGRSDADGRSRASGLGLGDYFRTVGRALRSRVVWSMCLMAGFRTMMQGGLLMFLPLYLADVLKVNPFWMGVTMMVLQLGGVVAAPIAGTLSDRIGRRPIVLAGMFSTTLLVLLLALVPNPVVFIACVSVLGFCMYAMRPVIHSWLMDLTPPELGATMTSAMFGTQAALSTVVPVIGGLIADRWGLDAVFYFLAASMVVANLLAFAVPRTEAAR